MSLFELVRLIQGSGPNKASEFTKPLASCFKSLSLILLPRFPGYLRLPDTIYNALINVLYPFGLAVIELRDGAYTYPTNSLPCDINIPLQYVLEFTFNKVTIRIPFNDLLLRIPRPENPSFCGLAFLLLDSQQERYTPIILGGSFAKNAYVVLDPENRTSAIAGLSRNDTATDIVEIGGRFGATLMNVRRATIDPSPNNGSSNKLPLGAVIESPQNPPNQTNWQGDHISHNRHELDACAGLLQELP
ncbi:hypothetical protein TWF132_008159 [Orbilia oligospora]|nr:hypothetical protein TWF751_004990 [Orbilia oligospora]KAF3287911.1 hypothetical protein TWF132_008159 [Orbilia oligospora]